MHKHRNAFVVTVLCTVTIVVAGYLYFTSPTVQERLKTIIEQELSSQFGGSISIGNYTVGLLAISADSITISHSLNAIDLSIEKIRVGFSLRALLSANPQPEKLIDEITLIGPKLTLTLQGSHTQDNEEVPLTADEISAQILEALPLRQVAVQQCQITLKTSRKHQIVQFTNLDGTILRAKGALALSLRGTNTQNSEDIVIEGLLSRDISEQFISLKADGIPLSTNLGDQSGTLTTSFSSDLTVSFAPVPYPQALIPSGTLALDDPHLIFQGTSIITGGRIALIADSGEIRDDEINLQGEDYTLSGDLSYSTTAGGIAALQLKNKGDTTSGLHLSLASEPQGTSLATLAINGSLPTGLGHISLRGNGHLLPSLSGVILDSLYYGNAWFHGIATGEYDTLGSYQFASTFTVDNHTDSATTSGQGSLKIKGNNGLFILDGHLDSLVYATPQAAFEFPSLHLSTHQGVIQLRGEDTTMVITGRLSGKDFTVDAQLHNRGVQKALTIAELPLAVDSGVAEVSLSGEHNDLHLSTKVLAKTPYGTLSLLGSGTYSDNLFTGSIDAGKWRYKNIEVPFNATLYRSDEKVVFTADEQYNRFKMKGAYYFSSNSFTKVKMKLLNFPATWGNVLFSEDQIPLQDGTISGEVTLKGSPSKIEGESRIELRNLKIGTEEAIATSLEISFDSSGVSAQPFSITKAEDTLFTLEQFHWGTELRLYGTFGKVNLTKLTNFPGGPKVQGNLEGTILTLKAQARLLFKSDSLSLKEHPFTNVFAQVRLSKDSLYLDSLAAQYHHVEVSGSFSRALSSSQKDDTIDFTLVAEGDFLSTLDSLTQEQIGGRGVGRLHMTGTLSDGALALSKGRLLIPAGVMHIHPYTQGGHVEKFYTDIRLGPGQVLLVNIRGELDRQMLVIKNRFPKDGALQPFIVGGLDCGVLEVFTDKGGIPLHIPGYMENRRNNLGYIETSGSSDVPHFTLSGPVQKPNIWGTLLLQKLEMTYPPLKDYEKSGSKRFDLTYHLNIGATGRSVTYFYQLGLKRSRRAPRIIECIIDPSEQIRLRGNLFDETFKIEGGLRSYKGSLFYGTWFDQAFELGLDFQPESRVSGGFNNAPIIWGSAETYSDSSRLEKVQVKVMTKDTVTGILRPKGRFTEIVVSPSTQANALSSEGDNESTYHKLTSQSFTDGTEAGEMVTEMGDKYMSSYFFNYWGRQLARKIGLDMIRIESSMMNNSFDYFQQKSEGTIAGTNFEQIALANTGITVGKYLFGSDLFFKWRTEFGTQDSIIVPEYKIGLEYQPIPYLWMDFNYGLSKDAYTEDVMVNPEVSLQLRLPLKSIREKEESTP